MENQRDTTTSYDGLLYKGRLYSRADKQSKWQFQTAFTQYRLKMNDAILESSVISIPPSNRHQYWKIELDSGTSFSQSQLPDIVVSWQQKKLVFLAQGAAPYTIAYGNKATQATQSKGIYSLIRTLQRSGGSPDKVSMNASVKNTDVITKAKETPWKFIGFWLLLVLGTAVLSYMAYSLYKQMNDEK